MAHIGVRNRTDSEQVLTYDARTIYFKPGSVRLVEGVPVDFIEQRMHLSHPEKTNPQTGEKIQSNTVNGLRLFDILTIDEALKAGARPDEDPQVLAFRREAEAKAKERAQLLKELKESLVEDGWVPPKAQTAPASSTKGGK